MFCLGHPEPSLMQFLLHSVVLTFRSGHRLPDACEERSMFSFAFAFRYSYFIIPNVSLTLAPGPAVSCVGHDDDGHIWV